MDGLDLTSSLDGISIPSNMPRSLHPDMASFVGPTFLGALFQGIETGVVLTQCLRFCSRARSREGAFVKACVAYVTVLSVVQTGVGFYGAWAQLIVHFGDYSVASIPNWTSKILPVMNAMLAAPVQGFLIWRCWLLTKRSKPLLVAFLLFYAASIAFAIATAKRVFSYDFKAAYEAVGAALEAGQPIQETGMDPIFLCCLTFPAIMDTALTTILFVFLLRSRTDVVTHRFRRTLTSLMFVIWEAALPPTACALTALGTYAATYHKSFLDLFFVCILGQLYVVALFVTINGFHEVKKRDSEAVRRAFSVPDVSFSTSAFSTGTRTRGGTTRTRSSSTSVTGEDILSTWARDASASFAIPLSIVLEEEGDDETNRSRSRTVGMSDDDDEDDERKAEEVMNGRSREGGILPVGSTVRVSFEPGTPPLRLSSSPLRRTSFNITTSRRTSSSTTSPPAAALAVEEELETEKERPFDDDDELEIVEDEEDDLEKGVVEEEDVESAPVTTLPRLSFSSSGSEGRKPHSHSLSQSRSRWAGLKKLGGGARIKTSAVG